MNQEFFAAIGWHTVAWAFVENGLEFLVIAIHELGGKTIEREAPWSLERKIKYLRRCFWRLAILAPYRERAIALLEHVKSASDNRHDIIHGTFTEHIFGSGEAKMIRLLRTKTGERVAKPFTLSTERVLQAATHAQDIGSALLTMAGEIIELLAEK
jgi:hypothetical protein